MSVNSGPLGCQPPEPLKKLSIQEKLESTNRWIDDIEREIALIRQGIGKWPEFTVDDRIEGLCKIWEFSENPDVPKVGIGTRDQKLDHAERVLERHRERANEKTGPSAIVNSVRTRDRVCSWWFLLAAVWCIVLALAGFREVWVYDLSKWTLCGLSGYAGFRSWKEGTIQLIVPFGIMTVIFNPIAPIRFGDAWKAVDALAGAAFLGVFLWDSGWIDKAWENRKKIGLYALMGVLPCCVVSIFVGAYFDSKNGGPQQRAAYLKEQKEKANAERSERMMKSFSQKKASKEESKKYPRALPGGGVDWTGVPGGPRE